MAIYYKAGEIINGFEIIRQDTEYKGGEGKGLRWIVKCPICKKEFSLDGRRMRMGKTKTCTDCKHLSKIKGKPGQRFGYLTAEKILGSDKDRHLIWLLKCDCGNYCTRPLSNLTNRSSCGCKLGKDYNIKDIIGQKFNALTVLSATDDRNNAGHVIWKCQCECGNICTSDTLSLKQNKKLSCGCQTESAGVRKIKEILNAENIYYQQEQRFATCKDILPLPFDFWVDQQYIIEFDGEHHFFYQECGWNTRANHEITVAHDKIKNQWCKENNIPLIRIPYYIDLSTLTLKDLLPDFSQFLVKEN